MHYLWNLPQPVDPPATSVERLQKSAERVRKTMEPTVGALVLSNWAFGCRHARRRLRQSSVLTTRQSGSILLHGHRSCSLARISCSCPTFLDTASKKSGLSRGNTIHLPRCQALFHKKEETKQYTTTQYGPTQSMPRSFSHLNPRFQPH